MEVLLFKPMLVVARYFLSTKTNFLSLIVFRNCGIIVFLKEIYGSTSIYIFE